MQDIADRAGVSRMTVSRVLRGGSRISTATAEKIHRIAREIGYRPNPLVSALMASLRQQHPAKDVSTLAFVTAFSTRYGWKEVAAFRRYFAGIEERARELGYRVEDLWLGEEKGIERSMRRILLARGIAGVMIAPTPEAGMPIHLPWENVAVVAFGYSMSIPPVHRVTNHLTRCLLTAVQRLRELGYRRIGLCMPRDGNERVDNAYLSGYLLFQHRLEDGEKPRPLLADDWNEEVFFSWFRSEKPDAVVTAAYRVNGKLVSDWITDAGLRIPKDVGFALLDWSPEHAPLAGIDQGFEKVGASAVDLLVEQLHRNERGIPDHQKVVMLEGKWREGSSVRRK